jgi:type II secretory ATPase GspE/PulE/Tfp pilus assembly ATPase PilB-like protein
VFSTLHTNSAPEAIVRMLEMGMDPFNFSDSLAGVLAQRLTRKLCDRCKEYDVLGEARLTELAEEYCFDTPILPAAVIGEWREKFSDNARLYHTVGCDACKQTGYRGRSGLHELLVTTPDVRQLAQRRAPASELRRMAIVDGMRTLKQDGIEKCLLGLTDLAEVRAAAS